MAARGSLLPLSLVFLAGVVLGAVGMAGWVHHRLAALHAGGPDTVDALAVRVLDEHLDLDAAQEERARAILRGVREQLVAFHDRHDEELRAILTAGARELETILREDQEADWGLLHDRMMHHLLLSGVLARHGAGGGHGAHGGDDAPGHGHRDGDEDG